MASLWPGTEITREALKVSEKIDDSESDLGSPDSDYPLLVLGKIQLPLAR